MVEPRAVLILDIDGTINPFYARIAKEQGQPAFKDFSEYAIEDSVFGKASAFLEGELLKRIFGELKEAGVELVWGSAWNEGSNLVLSMLGIEDRWPTIDFSEGIDFSPSIMSWKLSTVRSYVENRYGDQMPLIWLEDELYEDAEAWLASRGSEQLSISPDRNRGLTRAHWQQVLDFVASLPERSEELARPQSNDRTTYGKEN